ncbi:P-loop containing nucleoside triphosphate hydrolase protein, partial [Catenaria anguillulae PL171]
MRSFHTITPHLDFATPGNRTSTLDPNMPPSQVRKKLVVVGDGGIGKSALLMTYAQKTFPTTYCPTVFENYTVTPATKSGKRIELSLWDTAGQEDYDRLRPLSYPDTDVVLICFALGGLIPSTDGSGSTSDCKMTYSNVLHKWYPEVSHFCPNVPIILVGTKKDLREEALNTGSTLFIPKEHGEILAGQIKAVAYYEVSALKWEPQEMDEFFTNICEVAIKGEAARKKGAGCLV